MSIDTFARAIGAPLWPLPDAEPGEPTRLRPEEARVNGHWVPTIAPADAVGDLADLYGGSDFVPNIRTAVSLVPDELGPLAEYAAANYVDLDDLLDLHASPRAISRPAMELLAARVSALNECFY